MDIDYILLPSLIALTCLLLAYLCIRCTLSSRSKRFGTTRRVAERLALSLAILMTLGLAVSSVLNAAMFASLRHDPPGRLYLVNGYRMRLDCSGTGAPTLVLESGLGYGGLGWAGVQPMLARTTRVCSYDRAGYGWSVPQPTPNDADHIASRLHALLAAAHISGPIVLMGQSLGGIYIRDFAARYPTMISGLVFVDSSVPFMDRHGVPLPTAPQWLLQTALSTGIAYWALRLEYPRAPAVAIEDTCFTNLNTAAAELANFDRSSAEVERTPSFGSLPILILSHDPALDLHDRPELRRIMLKADAMQPELLKLSTRSRRIIVRGSGHAIQFFRPRLLAQQVALFIHQIRDSAPPSAHVPRS